MGEDLKSSTLDLAITEARSILTGRLTIRGADGLEIWDGALLLYESNPRAALSSPTERLWGRAPVG
jgi:hypothetical protein